MKLSESILEWQSVDDMPEANKTIALLVKYDDGELHLFSTMNYRVKKVSWLDYEILAWAYIDIDEIQKDIKNKDFDYEWVKSLHNNATKGGKL